MIPVGLKNDPVQLNVHFFILQPSLAVSHLAKVYRSIQCRCYCGNNRFLNQAIINLFRQQKQSITLNT